MNSIHSVKKYDINSNLILFNNGRLNLEDFYEKIDSFIVFNSNEILFIFDTNEKNKFSFPNIPNNFGYKIDSCSTSFFILYDKESLNFETFTHTKEAIYSIFDKQIVYQGGILGDRIINNFAIGGINKNVIDIFNIDKKNHQLSFPLSLLDTLQVGSKEVPYKVSEFCDIYKNILITTFTNGDILLLDIEKGKPIKLFEGTKIKEGLFQKEENSSIYLGLKFKTYIEIDVEKQEIIKQLDLEEYFKKKFNRSILVPINTTIYRNGLIYFIADTNIVGVFNPKTIDVVDFYEFEFENKQTMLKGGKENLQVNGTNIYCLDNQHNLYTLEFNPPS